MKKTFFILVLINFNLILSNLKKYDPLLVVVLMVKDEQDVMVPTLEPFVNAGIDSYLIFDTGSTDKTIEVTEKYFKSKNVKNGIIIQEPFIAFDKSRNRALDLAKEKFPNSAFLLMIDAEWYIKNVAGLINFCKENQNDLCPTYQITLDTGDSLMTHLRLIRKNSRVFFKGKVHEVIDSNFYRSVPNNICIDYRPTQKSAEKTRKRWERDLKLLLEDYNDDPSSPRTTFYLAQTYECLGDFHNAHKYYEIRSTQPGWHEENYETFYRLGRVTEILLKNDNKFTWHMAFDYYCKAYDLRPQRAEPLVKIATHYWPNGEIKPDANIQLSYLFAKRAMDLPFPEGEKLWIDKDMYNFERYNAVSKAAWHFKDYDVGEQATLLAIKDQLKDRAPHLYNNLMIYRDAKKNNK